MAQQKTRRPPAPNPHPNPAQQKASAPQIFRKERMRKAVEMRKLGLTFQQIGEELQVSTQTAWEMVKQAMDEIPIDTVSDLRRMQLERCNAFLFVLQPMISQGSESAINTALRVMDKMDRYLGTEAPERHETILGGGISIDGNMQVNGGVLAIPVDRDQYIAGLQKMAGIIDAEEIPQENTAPENTGQREIPASTGDPDVPTLEEIEHTLDEMDAISEPAVSDLPEVCGRYVGPGRAATGADPCKRCGHTKEEH